MAPTPVNPFRPSLGSPDTRPRAWTAGVLAFGLAMTIDRVATLEWSFPYCNDPQDGPAAAVFGVPIPYQRWNGFSSLEYHFAPHLYVLNILLVALALFPALRHAMRRVAPLQSRLGDRVLRSAGVLLCLGNFAVTYVALAGGLWRPVLNIGHSPGRAYSEYRPVRLTSTRHYDCTPSRFWFGPLNRAEPTLPGTR
jgi:hypothetical protein